MYFFKGSFKNTSNLDATIGLDIGSRMIKWVGLDGNHRLKHYAIQAIPDAMANPPSDAKIAMLLKETLLERKFIKNCILNIPDSLIFSQWIQIDHPNNQNINEIIESFIEKSIFYPLSKIYFDYQIFDLLPESKKYNVLIVVCRKEDLDFRLNIIQQANLTPTIVEINSHALERAYFYFYPNLKDENNILLEIGSSQMTFLFFNNAQTIVYCENLNNVSDQENILLQIKRGIKRYVFSYPCCVLNQIYFICNNRFLLNYLLTKLDGFLELKVQKLKKELPVNSTLDKNKLRENYFNLYLSYGLALRTYLSKK